VEALWRAALRKSLEGWTIYVIDICPPYGFIALMPFALAKQRIGSDYCSCSSGFPLVIAASKQPRKSRSIFAIAFSVTSDCR